MKRISLLFVVFIVSFSTHAQHTVQMRNLWADPEVHVLFEGYTVSFTIKDINRALELLAETGDSTYGTSSGLDTAKQYYVELYPGFRTEYRNSLQPLLQKGVGAFLLTSGHAVIKNPKHKKVKYIIVDIKPLIGGVDVTDVKFYDPNTDKLIFNGQIAAGMYHKDLGIDY